VIYVVFSQHTKQVSTVITCVRKVLNLCQSHHDNNFSVFLSQSRYQYQGDTFKHARTDVRYDIFTAIKIEIVVLKVKMESWSSKMLVFLPHN